MNHKGPKEPIPTDGRTLTLYQSRQRGRLYWYICWQDDQGKGREHYLGKKLPAYLAIYLDMKRAAEESLQAAIRVYVRQRLRKEA